MNVCVIDFTTCFSRYRSNFSNPDRSLIFHNNAYENPTLQLVAINLGPKLPLMPQLLELSRVSKKEASLRITVPKKAAEILDVKSGDIVGFYEDNGSIVLRKMK